MKSFDGSRRKVPRIAPQIPIADQSIDQLTLEPTDPRGHRKEQPEQIATDIKSFGLNARIVIDCNLQCAAAVLGRSEVSTARINNFTQAPASHAVTVVDLAGEAEGAHAV